MKLLANLMAIGFTEYEAKVYLAMMRDSPATGYQLGKQAGVPRSMVYEALGRLESRGAVLKTEEHRSTLYRPVPPDVLIDRFKRQHNQVLEDLRSGLHAIFSSRQEDYLWSIRGQGSVVAYAAQMIEKSEKDILVVMTDQALDALRSFLKDAHQRGVTIGALLTGEGNLECGQVAYHPPLESERHQLTNMLVVVTDSQQALIASSDVETTATITSNHNLVLIARQFVWMELFAQRINAKIGPELLPLLDEDDQEILESYTR
jgi:HTH-type transcriptional regulator, sugar sensing transcriptional regulator